MADETSNTIDDLTKKILNYLSIVTDDVDVITNIKLKIATVKEYLISGGASQLKGDTAELKENAIACIAIGVNDLLNNKAGDTKFSPAFNILAMQICRGG